MNVYCKDKEELKRVLDRIHFKTFFSKMLLKKIAENWSERIPVISFNLDYISNTTLADTHEDGFLSANQYLYS